MRKSRKDYAYVVNLCQPARRSKANQSALVLVVDAPSWIYREQRGVSLGLLLYSIPVSPRDTSAIGNTAVVLGCALCISLAPGQCTSRLRRVFLGGVTSGLLMRVSQWTRKKLIRIHEMSTCCALLCFFSPSRGRS